MAAGPWFLDGNNIMGSRPDGWWNDREGAAVRLADHVARWCRTHDDDVLLVFDGAPAERVSVMAGGNLSIRFADRPGRNAADDVIVELVEDALVEQVRVMVVTADRGLIDRLPPGAAVERPTRFLGRLDAAAS